MQVSASYISPDDRNMPPHQLREDVDENGKPVIYEADAEGNKTTLKETESREEAVPGEGSSSAGPEEKDITD